MAVVEYRSHTRGGWQAALAEGFHTVEELLCYLGLDAAAVNISAAAAAQFPLRVTRSWAARISRGDPEDPLLRQVLPVSAETEVHAGFSADPLQEHDYRCGDGLLCKYQGRMLLISTAACAIHCRYCFRRHFPYQQERFSSSRLAAVIATIQADPSITELILSGGDPLMLGDDNLDRLCMQLGSVPQVTRLRLHTRLPVVLPERVNAALLATLQQVAAQPVVVIHVNHPQELDTSVQQALSRLQAAGVCLLNQSVLLAGVNDRVDILCDLSERLFACGVLPYYLHQLDTVAGSAHFFVPPQSAAQLIQALRDRLPGYLVPRWVQEVPGKKHKIPLPVIN